MKALPTIIIFSTLLALVGCGKNNESGKTGQIPGLSPYSTGVCMTYSTPGVCSQYQNPLVYPSGYSYQGFNLDTVQQENPCVYSSTYGQTNLARMLFQKTISMPTIITQGDMYVGVTSFGDVAAIIGNGTPNPTFVAYLCPRPTSAPPIITSQALIGAYTNCAVKPITAVNLAFPDGSEAHFRSLSPGGSSIKQKFSFCQQ